MELQDWADLWRPDLAGKISMVDSPREVVGAVLKYMGASYNTNDLNSEVNGGREAVKHNLVLLAKQVLLLLLSINKRYQSIVDRKEYFSVSVFPNYKFNFLYILCYCRFDSLIVQTI